MARVQLNVWVSEADRAQIKALAAQRGMPVGVLVTEAVLGAVQSPDAVLTAKASDALARAQLALERVAGVESAVEDFESRLGRLEAMAQGASY